MLGGLQSRERLKVAFRCFRGKPLVYPITMKKTIERKLDKFECWAGKNLKNRITAYSPAIIAASVFLYRAIDLAYQIKALK